ncbi:MAG: ATP-dependent helicase [Anaerolineae bacterium]|jgi:DNA helicase-2/ATP-dependent DNA helicase PcrA|nr:ATP-dependent helicase [Anaerolineae bacterium]
MTQPFKPRPHQAEVLKYTGGRMGISAVPGSGKTRTLAQLAAKLIQSKKLADDQEVLIVTLVNSAVTNFKSQIDGLMNQKGNLAGFGYRVRTLHGLANDIVREKAHLLGMGDNFTILDERDSQTIITDAVEAWCKGHPQGGSEYFLPDLSEDRVAYLLINEWQRDAVGIATNVIKQAKDWRITPEALRQKLDTFPQKLPLAEMCHAVYVNYQRSLAYRGAVDFQDLISYALTLLEGHESYLDLLRKKFPYILEDEAQDSSELQQSILELLVGKKGNWVRVGDPNQAIYETFTTANPDYLVKFINSSGVKKRELPQSGRSTASIIRLANFLIDWSQSRYPVESVRVKEPLKLPYIQVTAPDDPQPNPPDNPRQVVIYPEPLRVDTSKDEEIDAVVASLKRWLPQNADKTVAVLVPKNERGGKFVLALKKAGLPVVELLRNTTTTRETAGALSFILDALAHPDAGKALGAAFRVWRRDDRENEVDNARNEHIIKVLNACDQLEDYLYPMGDDWLDSETVQSLVAEVDSAHDLLVRFKTMMYRWQEAIVLPIDQLIVTIAGELFSIATDLAIAHSLALHLKRQANLNPHWRINEFVTELRAIAQNKRNIANLPEEDEDYQPDNYKGVVTIATMHKAKGLEWDRVYLTSLNTYDFPAAFPEDNYMGESWYVRDKLNLSEEALHQLRCLKDGNVYEEGVGTARGRVNYSAERLRLLYVGITRARRELILMWNTGRKGDLRPSVAFEALRTFWETHGQ